MTASGDAKTILLRIHQNAMSSEEFFFFGGGGYATHMTEFQPDLGLHVETHVHIGGCGPLVIVARLTQTLTVVVEPTQT